MGKLPILRKWKIQFFPMIFASVDEASTLSHMYAEPDHCPVNDNPSHRHHIHTVKNSENILKKNRSFSQKLRTFFSKKCIFFSIFGE